VAAQFFGVCERKDGVARLHENRPPDKTEIDDVARRVHDRAVRWLRRHGNIDECPLDERNNEPTDATPMDGLSRRGTRAVDRIERTKEGIGR
jgi:hypothetical protein